MFRLKVIGIGGTGTNLLAFVPRYLAYQWESKRGVEVTLVDGDKFEGRNEDRQIFDEQGNKADVTAARLRREFPSLTVLSIPEFVTPQNVREIVRPRDVVLLAVDNHATRKLVFDRCRGLSNVTLISAGNDLVDGSVMVYIRKKGKDVTDPVRLHPEIQFPQDRNPGEDPSCMALAAEGEPQIVITNMAAALGMAMALFQFLKGRVPAEETYFDIWDGVFRPRKEERP